jgi:predicted thioesterase
MKSGPKVNQVAEACFVLERKGAIDFAVEGTPAGLCTPWLIWFLEHAARAAVLLVLETGESMARAHVDVRHAGARPLAEKVT